MNKLLMTAFLIFGIVAVSNADPVLNETTPGVYTDIFPNDSSYGRYTNSGSYLGTFQGNDTINSLDNVVANLATFGIVAELTQASVRYTTTNEDTGDVLGTYTGPDGDDIDEAYASRTGTWTALPAPITNISYYSVKAGNYYSLYQLSDPLGTGSWSTYDMWQYGQDNNLTGLGGDGGLEISHFSGFLPTPAPEPATTLLFGTGLVGLVGSRLRKKK